MSATDEQAESAESIAQDSRDRLRKLRRSIRSSIAVSRRRGDFDPHEHVARFGGTLEWRHEELGWEIGQSRMKLAARLQAELEEFNVSYLTYAYAALTIAEHLNLQASGDWRSGNRAKVKLDVLCELHSQAISVMEEVLAMVAAGLPTGAWARWRTLYEIAVVAHFLARSPNDTSDRYLASHLPSILKQLDLAISDTPKGERERRARLLEDRATVSAKVDEIVNRYGPEVRAPYGWAARRLAQKRVRFSDIEARARSTGFKVMPRDDRTMYKEASQHIHAERLSSLRTLSDVSDNGGLLIGATLEPSRVQAMSIWTFSNLTWTLGELVSRTQEVPEALYWAYVVHMYALDADTETWHRMHTVNTGYLRDTLALRNE